MPHQAPGLRVLADFASDAVHFKLLHPAAVVAWADQLIEAADLPPTWMMDLSLADEADPIAVRDALRDVPGTPEPEESVALLNALILREWRGGHLTIGRVRGIGWELYRSEFERHDLSRWGVVVECEGESLDEGYISEETMRRIIDRELAPFESRISQLPPWAKWA